MIYKRLCVIDTAFSFLDFAINTIKKQTASSAAVAKKRAPWELELATLEKA